MRVTNEFKSPNNKECFTCKVTLNLDQFHKRKSAKDGHRNKCKGCQKDYHRNYYVDNLEKTLNRVKIYKRNNKTKITNYRIIYNLLNKNTKRSYDKFYRLNNRHLKNSHNAKRRSAKLNAVPKWVNQAELDAITCLYTEAKRLEELHSEPYHVDHLIPLIHPLVCGLHCLSNLRVIVAKENLITPENFDVLLSWLDLNHEIAAEKYEKIRFNHNLSFANAALFGRRDFV